jgi:hypothetical protein
VSARGVVSARMLIAGSAVAAIALVSAYAIAGGGSYAPTPVADPCEERTWRGPEGLQESAQQFALSALDGAACELGVSREELAIGLSSADARARFGAEHGVDEAELEEAVRAGLVRAIDDAEQAGAVDAAVADGLRAIASRLPVDEAIAVIEDGGEFLSSADDLLGGLLDRAAGLVD